MSSFLTRFLIRPVFAVILLVLQSHAWASGVTVTHAMGDTDISDSTRVVTLYQGATDSALALGVQPVGVVESWAQQPVYDYLNNRLGDEVTYVGLETQPNLEVIARLQPDVIIGAKARHEKIYGQLSQIAPTVLAENVYDFKRTLELTAEATGRTEKGDELWQAWQARTQAFRDHLSAEQQQWPLTASILNVRADHLRLYLEDSFPGAVLKDIGFEFPLSEQASWGMKLKTKEALPTVNADVFFILFDGDDAAVQQNYDAWRLHPLWNVLKAPRAGQVHEVDRITWLLSGGILGANLMLDQLSAIYERAPAN
ncbi:ABC transporter substrate-binding protein [Marinomonas ostreistagni]|uniref:ABC transporter substrate-binding protein n=1 Tax=Marinomonas ostreistagni TaxID=359209 RepID=UPI0019516D79|nr:iron-siderophore ABC transporter substrate-binding protein [Marinomonas ostreistagni]MBM6550784.1 iron-siderophore ABC transporter substrate-binding protein [Marinomonas ostreistagni]